MEMKIQEDADNHKCPKRFGKILTLEISDSGQAYCCSCHRQLSQGQINPRCFYHRKFQRALEREPRRER